MKKNDLALIILIVSIALAVSYFTLRAIIGNPAKHGATAEVVEPISVQLQPPSATVFNSNAINPTIVIQIGNPSNQQPFGR